MQPLNVTTTHTKRRRVAGLFASDRASDISDPATRSKGCAATSCRGAYTHVQHTCGGGCAIRCASFDPGPKVSAQWWQCIPLDFVRFLAEETM